GGSWSPGRPAGGGGATCRAWAGAAASRVPTSPSAAPAEPNRATGHRPPTTDNRSPPADHLPLPLHDPPSVTYLPTGASNMQALIPAGDPRGVPRPRSESPPGPRRI